MFLQHSHKVEPYNEHRTTLSIGHLDHYLLLIAPALHTQNGQELDGDGRQQSLHHTAILISQPNFYAEGENKPCKKQETLPFCISSAPTALHYTLYNHLLGMFLGSVAAAETEFNAILKELRIEQPK